jgi:hypothetical protein
LIAAVRGAKTPWAGVAVPAASRWPWATGMDLGFGET